MLRKIRGPKRDMETEDWSKLHNKELHDLCFSPNIIRVMKYSPMSWVGQVARVGERRGE
jgi:hypothetical protein